MLNVQAAAKINLSLEVTGKRPDGYHELVSVMQEVTLVDDLSARPSANVTFTCTDSSLHVRHNLVVKAARMLQAHFGGTGGCDLSLDKRIPIAAGLGGGSSDAASTLELLSRMWGIEAECTDLLPVAATIGSDVPFFLYGGTALVEGYGERVTALPDPAQTWYVLTNPRFAVSTTDAFRALTPSSWTDGHVTRSVARSFREGGRPGFGINAFQQVLFDLYPAAQRCYDVVERLAPHRTIVSGSGPTVVSWFERRVDADTAATALAQDGYWTAVVQNRARTERIRLCP